MTRAENYTVLRKIVDESSSSHKDELLAFIDRQLKDLAARAERAKKRAIEEKEWRESGELLDWEDELQDYIEVALTDEYQTIDDIMDQFEYKGMTRKKVASRLDKLIKEGYAERKRICLNHNDHVVVYRAI